MQSFHIARLAAFGLALAVAGPLAAQTAQPGNAQHGNVQHGPGRRGNMFAELNLTDAQKAQIKAIHAKYKAELSASKAAAKPDLDAARAARARGDTAAARAAFARARASMKASKPVRDREMAELRNVLTPEQRQTLDARKTQWKAEHKGGEKRHGEPRISPTGKL